MMRVSRGHSKDLCGHNYIRLRILQPNPTKHLFARAHLLRQIKGPSDAWLVLHLEGKIFWPNLVILEEYHFDHFKKIRFTFPPSQQDEKQKG